MASTYPLGLDYSAGRPSGASLRRAGVSFVIRYIDDPSRWDTKHINAHEYQDLIAHDIAVYLVVERVTGDWRGGRTAGRALASAARRGADAIGYPAGGIIFVTVDTHVSAADVPTTVQFVAGAADYLGHEAAGAYGFSEHINAVVAANTCSWFWQTGSRSALNPKAHVYQCNDRANLTIDNVPCDVNELHRPMNGELPVTPDEIEKVAAAVVAKLTSDIPYALRVRTQLTTALNDTQHPLAQFDQLGRAIGGVDTLTHALASELDEVHTKLDGLNPGGTVDPGALAAALDYGKLAKAMVAELGGKLAGGTTSTGVVQSTSGAGGQVTVTGGPTP